MALTGNRIGLNLGVPGQVPSSRLSVTSPIKISCIIERWNCENAARPICRFTSLSSRAETADDKEEERN